MPVRDVPYRHADQVIQLLTDIANGALALHGRDLYNMFGLYSQELKYDILELFEAGFLDIELQPHTIADRAILVEPSLKNVRRMRYLWDYFSFIYMSHKIQNIKRRQLAAGSLNQRTILYLRGADYQLAISQKGAAIGYSTDYDYDFITTILRGLYQDYCVFKALSPCDLTAYMSMLPHFLARFGNSLGSVIEFARLSEGGFFFSTSNWRERVTTLFSSSSLFLVYVSNQSNGLKHELDNLLAHGLIDHVILVLDDRRFEARARFFELQRELERRGEDIYLSVDREACMVEDADGFEQIVASFPNKIHLSEDRDETLSEIIALIPEVSRSVPLDYEEFPFEFSIALTPDQQAAFEVVLDSIEHHILEALGSGSVSNWAVLMLYIELSILFNLARGDVLQAARSTAAFGVVCDCIGGIVSTMAPERATEVEPVFGQCGGLASDIARTALAMGEWNDYNDRRQGVKATLSEIAKTVYDAMMHSLHVSGSLLIKKAKPDVSRVSGSDRKELLDRYLAVTAGRLSNDGPDKGAGD